MRIAFLLFDQMDLMDFAGPFEVLLTANRLSARDGLAAPFDLVTVSPDGEPVQAYGGVGLIPQAEPELLGSIDLLVVPGTVDVGRAVADPTLVTAVEVLADRATVTTSVCTGAFLLAEANLLADHRWTTHWEDIAALSAQIPGGVRARIVDSADVVTAGGIGCGLDLGFHLVERFVDRDLAQRCARQMDVRWEPADVT